MMEGDFTLNKTGWYTVQTVAPNDFINDNLQSRDYGIYYSVVFVGDAETFLWQTKTEPVQGEKYWGHLEKAKSGKSVKFKKDKDAPSHTPDGKPSAQTKQENEKGDAITRSMVVKLAFQGFISAEGMLPQEDKHWRQIDYMADMLYKTIQGIKPDEVIEVPDKELTEEDIDD